MTSRELENLVRIGGLKKETGTQIEFDGLIRSGRMRLNDARNAANSYVVFQGLPHTLGLDATVWRILAKCHERRNVAEYEGHLEVDEQLLKDLVASAEKVHAAVISLGPVPVNPHLSKQI